MMKTVIAALALFASSASASKIWDGSFSSYSSSSDFDKWSWSNEVGEYQWYIHGSGATSKYLNVDASYKNPASTETHGLKLTIDNTAFWNGQTMQRTELIPQTTANLGSGQTYYHFSLMHSSTNPPDTSVEHQILFFESHFVQLKLGVAPNPTYLQFFAGSNSVWSTPFVAGTWYNFAYDINFSSGAVGLYFSTGSSPLAKVVSGVSTSPSTNSADFHVGVLAFGHSTEDWYISGVYIESGSITTSIGSGSSGSGSTVTSSTTSVSGGTTSKPVTTPTTTTTSVATTTSATSGPAQTKYGQCGGTGWTGATTCVSGSTCSAVSPPYYYQCL